VLGEESASTRHGRTYSLTEPSRGQASLNPTNGTAVVAKRKLRE
jgi:hypothetical protein